jgi:hypothetical protein
MQRKDTFQRRHFNRIAEIVSALPDGERERVAVHFARRLSADNAGFQEGRFLEACGCDPAERRIQDRRPVDPWNLPGPEDPLPDSRAGIRRARGGGC